MVFSDDRAVVCVWASERRFPASVALSVNEERGAMRFFFGILVGVCLTFGTAYVVDTMRNAPGPDGKDARRMVNWDVVGGDMRGLSTGVQDLWARLVGGARQLDRQVDRPRNS